MAGQIIYKEESYRIMGACFEVYKEKGPGFARSILVSGIAKDLCTFVYFVYFVVGSSLPERERKPRAGSIEPERLCYDSLNIEYRTRNDE